MSLRSERVRACLLLAAGAVAVVLVFWAILPGSYRTWESGDYPYYEAVARSILAGRGLRLADGGLATRYAPGYSLWLAGLFAVAGHLGIAETAVHSASIFLCMALTTVLLFLLAGSIWSTRPALVAAAAWMTYPLALWLTKEPRSEMPFLVLFYSGLFLFSRAQRSGKHAWPTYFLAGVALGAATLLRNIALGIGPLLGLAVWFGRRELKRTARLALIAALLTGTLVLILPWEMWLLANTGQVLPLGTNGPFSIRDGLTFAVELRDYRQPNSQPADVQALMSEIYERALAGELASTGSIVSFLWFKARTEPLTVARLYAIKAVRSWYATDSMRFENLIPLLQIPYLLLVLYGSVRAWKRGGVFRQAAALIWLITLYFWGMTVSVLSIVRYMMPAMGLLFILLPAALPAGYCGRARAPVSLDV